MFTRISAVAFVLVSSVALVYAMLNASPAPPMIIVLNSIFFGAMISVVVTYWKLIYVTFINIRHYDRARHYVLGAALLWASVSILIAKSSILGEYNPEQFMFGVFGRLAAILAAIFQVTAPDFGGKWAITDARKSLIYGLSIGVAAAICSLILQKG